MSDPAFQEKVAAGRAANLAAREPGEPHDQKAKRSSRSNRLAKKAQKAMTPGQLKWLAQKAKTDAAAAEFKRRCLARGLPMPVREFRFAEPDRQWEADFAWPDERVILEVEGAAWSGGRHTRGSGYLQDMEKYNEMTLRGFRLLRCVPKTLNTDATLGMIAQLLEAA